MYVCICICIGIGVSIGIGISLLVLMEYRDPEESIGSGEAGLTGVNLPVWGLVNFSSLED